MIDVITMQITWSSSVIIISYSLVINGFSSLLKALLLFFALTEWQPKWQLVKPGSCNPGIRRTSNLLWPQWSRRGSTGRPGPRSRSLPRSRWRRHCSQRTRPGDLVAGNEIEHYIRSQQSQTWDGWVVCCPFVEKTLLKDGRATNCHEDYLLPFDTAANKVLLDSWKKSAISWILALTSKYLCTTTFSS